MERNKTTYQVFHQILNRTYQVQGRDNNIDPAIANPPLMQQNPDTVKVRVRGRGNPNPSPNPKQPAAAPAEPGYG